jgi:hypothetical protein
MVLESHGSTPERMPVAADSSNASRLIAKKNFEVILTSGSSYHDTQEQVQSLVAKGHATWSGPKRIRMKPDESKRAIWEPKQSGHRGPLVLQLT